MINLDKTTNTNRANPGREQERARLAFESAFRDGISQGDLSPYLSSIAFSLSFYLSFDRIWCRRNFRETREVRRRRWRCFLRWRDKARFKGGGRGSLVGPGIDVIQWRQTEPCRKLARATLVKFDRWKTSFEGEFLLTYVIYSFTQFYMKMTSIKKKFISFREKLQ